jgi:hypothetical protein
MIESNHSSSIQTNSKTHDNILPESYALRSIFLSSPLVCFGSGGVRSR